MIIYRITNLINGKLYIGQTSKTLNCRWAVHKSCKRITPLTSALKKYGSENFSIFPIVTALAVQFMDELEREAIKCADCIYPKGYNLLDGGNVSHLRGRTPWNKGKKATEAAINNQSKAHLGLPASNRKTIVCVETGEVFESTYAASKSMNLQRSKISNVLHGKRKHTGGYTFVFARLKAA